MSSVATLKEECFDTSVSAVMWLYQAIEVVAFQNEGHEPESTQRQSIGRNSRLENNVVYHINKGDRTEKNSMGLLS